MLAIEQWPMNRIALARSAGYAGVCATDWSWGALITDLDNDGSKIFLWPMAFTRTSPTRTISSIFQTTSFIKSSIGEKLITKADRPDTLQPIPNYAFSNNGDLTFTNRAGMGAGRNRVSPMARPMATWIMTATLTWW